MTWLQERLGLVRALVPRSQQAVHPTERVETLAASPLLSETDSVSSSDSQD